MELERTNPAQAAESSISELATVPHVLCTHLFQDALEHPAVLLWFGSLFFPTQDFCFGVSVVWTTRNAAAASPTSWSWDPSASSAQRHSLFGTETGPRLLGTPHAWHTDRSCHLRTHRLLQRVSVRAAGCSAQRQKDEKVAFSPLELFSRSRALPAQTRSFMSCRRTK